MKQDIELTEITVEEDKSKQAFQEVLKLLEEIIQLDDPYINLKTGETLSKAKIKTEDLNDCVINRAIANIKERADKFIQVKEDQPLLNNIGLNQENIKDFIKKIEIELECVITKESTTNLWVTKDGYSYDYDFLALVFKDKENDFIPSLVMSRGNLTEEEMKTTTFISIKKEEAHSNLILNELIKNCQLAGLIQEEEFSLSEAFKEKLEKMNAQQEKRKVRDKSIERSERIKTSIIYLITYSVHFTTLLPLLPFLNKELDAQFIPSVNKKILENSCQQYHDKEITGNYQEELNFLKPAADTSFLVMFPIVMCIFHRFRYYLSWKILSSMTGLYAGIYFMSLDLLINRNKPGVLINMLYSCLGNDNLLNLCGNLNSNDNLQEALKTAQECIHDKVGDFEIGWLIAGPIVTTVYIFLIMMLTHFLEPKLSDSFSACWDKHFLRQNRGVIEEINDDQEQELSLINADL